MEDIPTASTMDSPTRRNRFKLIGLPELAEGCVSEEEVGLVQGDLRDYVWFSYREGFAAVAGQGSDKGWGCLHRAGQMMLMTTFRRHLQMRSELLLHLFMDLPEASFSIQRITTSGEQHGKAGGTWFAPSTFARVTASLLASPQPDMKDLFTRPLTTYISDNQQIERPAVLSAASSGGVLLLIPFMFGMETVDERNAVFLQECLASKWCTGVVGGKTKHALYLIGYDAKSGVAVCLDPHQVQPAFTSMPSLGVVQVPASSPACYADISKLEPSSLLCFYARDTKDAEELLEFLSKAQLANVSWKLFSIVDSIPTDNTPSALHEIGDCEVKDDEEEEEDDEWVAL